VVTIDGVLDWMIGFIDTLHTPLRTTGNYSAIAILHTSQLNVMLPPHIAEHSPRDLEWGCVDSVLMLPPHIAEHSPRDLEWGCVDSVLARARGMVGIRAEGERRCV
jgi:hypothetical protein